VTGQFLYSRRELMLLLGGAMTAGRGLPLSKRRCWRSAALPVRRLTTNMLAGAISEA